MDRDNDYRDILSILAVAIQADHIIGESTGRHVDNDHT